MTGSGVDNAKDRDGVLGHGGVAERSKNSDCKRDSDFQNNTLLLIVQFLSELNINVILSVYNSFFVIEHNRLL